MFGLVVSLLNVGFHLLLVYFPCLYSQMYFIPFLILDLHHKIMDLVKQLEFKRCAPYKMKNVKYVFIPSHLWPHVYFISH